MKNQKLFDEFKKTIPPIFAATELDRLTGNAMKWTTLQNKRSSKTLPESQKPPKSCFRHDGARKILLVRDELMNWWLETLSGNE